MDTLPSPDSSFTCLLVKKFVQNFISVRDRPQKVQKQGRDERVQKDYPTSANNTQHTCMYM